MDETNKLPLKRVELSLTKFNEVAIPHHLDLLRQHRANIIKYEAAGRWERVRSEQLHAARVTSQLRALLGQLEALRRRVAAPDRPAFDRLTQRARDLTLTAIVDYLETSPLSINRRSPSPAADGAASAGSGSGSVAGSVASAGSGSVGRVAGPELLQLQVDEQELALREREAVLRGWCSLQQEVRALHDTWQALAGAARDQAPPVAAATAAVETASENVSAARAALLSAERLRAAGWGAGGAALGALAGGPVGLLVGLKAGAAALVAGSALGYWGARLLGANRRKQLTNGDATGSDAAGSDAAGSDAAAVGDVDAEHDKNK